MFFELGELVLFCWICQDPDLTEAGLDFCLMNSFITAPPKFPPSPITRMDGPIVLLIGTCLDVL